MSKSDDTIVFWTQQIVSLRVTLFEILLLS